MTATDKNKNIPELRFPDFEGEWVKKKLGDIVIKVGSGSTPRGGEDVYQKTGIPFIRSQNVINNQLILDDTHIPEYIHKKMDGSKVLPNDILLNITGASIGRSCVVPDNFVEGNVNQHVSIIRLKNDNPKFLQTVISSFQGQKLIFEGQTGSGREGLNFQTIRSFKIFFPSIPEQQKIATFLTAVDKRIHLLTQKKENLEHYKKGVMQKLFSRELRFRDENGNEFSEWEEKPLKTIIKKFIVPMRDKPKDLFGEIPWCRIEDFNGKYLHSSKTNQGVNEETINKMNLKVFPVDTLLVSCSAYLGKCAIVKKELITNQTFIGLVPDKTKIDVEFLFYIMGRSESKLNRLSSGTTISYLSREEFEKFKIEITSLPEQQKIATFLSAIDKQIEQVARQIEHSNQWKKGLLQKMLV